MGVLARAARTLVDIATAVVLVNTAFWLISVYPTDPRGVQSFVTFLIVLWVGVAGVMRSLRGVAVTSGMTPLGAAQAVVARPVSRDIAEHEAAHAVVAHAIGVVEISARMHRHDGLGASVSGHHPEGLPAADAEWQSLVVALAGQTYDHARGIHDAGSRNDMRYMLESALAIMSIGRCPTGYSGPLTIEGLCAAARNLATKILAERRELVQSVADALAAGGFFGPDQMRALLEPQAAGVAVAYPDKATAERALISSPLVDSLCGEDCLDAYVEGTVPEGYEEIVPDNDDRLPSASPVREGGVSEVGVPHTVRV